MNEIDPSSILNHLENGSLGIALEFEHISEYDKFLKLSYSGRNQKERRFWIYALYNNATDIGSPPFTIASIYFIERAENKGFIEIPLRSFLNKKCSILSKNLKEEYVKQLKIIDLAERYYKDKLSSVTININFKCTIVNDQLISIQSPSNLKATAYLSSQIINIEKTLRNDLKAYNLDKFELNCQKSMQLIDMISE